MTGAGTDREIGMAVGLVAAHENAAALLFDEVPGYPKGFRILANLFGGKRKNMSLGFPTGLDKVELSDAFAEVFMDQGDLIPPNEVEGGPIFENIQLGDDVDLDVFPAPLWHEKDGGRYIGTGSYHVTRDPETGWVNLGCYRVMLKDKQTVAHNVLPSHHADYHRQKYEAKGERLPMAIVLGGDPMCFFMGASALGEEVGEFEMAGRMRGRPIELVKGKVTGLPFPADAEIVLEGYLDSSRIEPEGPFGDWTGTYTEKGRPNPVVDIKAVYYRNDPIMLAFIPQSLPDEFSRFCAIRSSAQVKRAIAAAGVPDVKEVWCHEIGAARMLIGVSITQRYAGHAKQAGHVASMVRASAVGSRWIIVTDDDVDVVDLEELIYAALTRSDPATSVDWITNAPGAPSDPRLTPWDRKKRNFVNSRMIFDACRPFHWRDDFPEPNKPTLETARDAAEMFGYLLKK